MKKFLKIASLLLCLALVISCAFGCSGSSDEETGEDDNSSKSGKLYVFNWGDYIGEETIEKFEEKYPNIDVIYDIFDSNESMYQKLIGSNIPYDILIPSDYMIERLIRENRLKEIDMSKLENYHYIDEKCLNTIYDPENKYSVPYTYGTLGILYNTKMVEEEPHSWNTLWDEQYKGEILMLDQVRDTMCLALKRLGYSANSTDPEEIEAARQSLVEQKHLVANYGNDDLKDKMIAGRYMFSVAYSGDAIWMIEGNEDLAYVVPDEGSNFFIDAMCIPTSSKNTEAAYLFIDFMNDPEIAYENAEYIGYSTPHTEALQLLGEDYIEDEVYNPSAETLAKCEQYVSFDAKTQKLYNESWRTIRQLTSLTPAVIVTLALFVVAVIAFVVREIVKSHKEKKESGIA